MTSTVVSHSLQPRRGFHSTLSTVVDLNHPDSNCSFFALYTFPPSVIIDQYELADRSLSFEFWGEPNLELPVFALDQPIDSQLLVNATPTDAHAKKVRVDIPVHARYQEPSLSSSPCSITISAPVCFWACRPSTALPSSSSNSPAGQSTMLHSLAHFSLPSTASYHATLEVPVASKHDLFSVEIGTATVVLVAFLWLAYRSWRTANALQPRHLKQQ